MKLDPRNDPAIGDVFDSRDNALNLLRLAFALLVIVSHSIILGGFGNEMVLGRESFGTMAVDAFFVTSGFLITASAGRNGVGRYLWQRVLRIMPGFWVCLVVTAFVIAPIAWVSQGHPLASYWSAHDGPFHYVLSNLFIKMDSYQIANTPSHVPFTTAWDGSLWTLEYEALCYLMVAALAVTSILGRRRIVLGLWVFAVCVGIVTYFVPGLIPESQVAVGMLVRFVPIFFAGSLIWLYRDEIPDSLALFLLSALLFVLSIFIPVVNLISGLPLAYACIWLGMHLPGKWVGAKYDISYGTYIYAFVVAQLLAVWHVNRWGYVPFTLMTVIVTVPLAFASCIFVERPALRLKRWSPSHRALPPDPVPAAALGE